MVLSPFKVSPNKLKYGDFEMDLILYVSVSDFEEIYIILYKVYETIGSIKDM